MSKQSTSGTNGGGAATGVGTDGGDNDEWRRSLNGGERSGRKKPGILRLDISKPRRSSGGFVEFRAHPEMLGEDSTSPSGQTSPHQLSVTWASQCDLNDPDSKAKQMLSHLESTTEKGIRLQEDKSSKLPANVNCPPLDAFGGDQQQPPSDDDDDEEYSISVSAIMQKRASLRGNRKRGSRISRRASSPMDHILDAISQSGDRRRSSVYTTSSDDGTNQDSTQEQIFENIRLHKEVIQSVKLQPWNIRKKLKLVRQAKTYVARHEGALQERFALSRSLRDLWARFKILMAARWKHWKRETSSFLTVLIPWELRIKEIESHFGSGVASYFTFLRWLLWVNIMMMIPLISFVIAPELLSTSQTESDPRKNMSSQERDVAGNFFTFWEFEGYLKYSPLFYGYYSNQSGAILRGYNLPLAYFLTAVAVYVYSFFATLRKMAENSRNSKLSSKDDECIFSWKLFTGWDFMIGHAETAHNRIASVVVGFKEALLEEAEKKKDKRNWRIILQRILVNILVLGLLAASGYTVVSAVDRSERVGAKASWFRRNEVNVIMTMLSFVLPMIFDALGLFENWHPRQQLRLQLARIMILNLLNLYSLMFSFIYKITGKDERLQSLKSVDQNVTIELDQVKEAIRNLTTITTTTLPISTPSVITSTTSALAHYLSQKRCFSVPVNCSVPKPTPALNLTTSMLLLNLSTTMLPTALWTDPTTHRLMTTTPFEEVSDFLTSTTGDSMAIDPMASPSSTTVNSFTDEDWSTSSTPFYSTSSYSTSPPPLSTTLEDYRSDFNETYFDYYDYFENIGSKENYDPEAGGGRNRRAIVEFADIWNNTTTSDIISSETTEYTTTSSLWDSSTDSSSTFSSSTDTTDEQYPIDQSSSTTMSAFIDTITDIANSSESESIRDKVLEFITNVTTIQPDIEKLNLTTITTTNPTVSTTISYVEEEDEESCMITICVTLPPYLYNIPQTTELVELSNTEPTNVSIINSLPPAQQLIYYEAREANLSKAKDIIRRNLTTMCWETSLGQELSKVIVFDTMMSIAAPLCIDFLRALFVRYMNKYWCWDMEKTFPQYGDFKIAESILNLVYNQGQVWMGIFFSPGLVIINFVKLMILMYLRSWIVLTCNVPHEVVFKASKSNNFYLSLLLTMLFLCVLPVGYAIVWLRPSWHCGPFSDYDRISEFFTTTIIKALPLELHKPLEYLTSPSTVIPLLLLLTLIIYYLISLTGALREANQDLRNQLVKEREEERKKMFKIPETKGNEQTAAALTNRWRKVLDASSPLTPPGAGQQPPDFDEAYKNQARNELLARIMKKALRKGSATSDDDSFVRGRDEDDTDTEHHESLPHDEESKEKMFGLSKLQNIRRTRKPSLVDIVQIARSEQNKAKESHPRGRFKIDKISKPDTNVRPEKIVKAEKVSQDRDNDPDTNSRVVSERRQSLLQKQAQVQEVDPTPVKPSDHPETDSKFAVIDEKTSDTLKKHKRKTQQPNSEPEVFKFDDKSVDRNRSKLNLKSSEPSRKDGDSAERKKQSETPHDEEKTDSNRHEKFLSFSKQGRKTIGNFMTLVREAVKKVEPNSPNGETAPTKTSPPEPVHSRPSTFESEAKIEPQLKTEFKFSSKPDLKKQTAPIPISQSAETARTQPESFDSEEDDKPGPTPPPVRSGSLRWAERPAPMRQDSQTSVWSDNIPTITISTTGSDDCIIEPNGNNENTITNGDDA